MNFKSKYLLLILAASFVIKLVLVFALHADLRSDSLVYHSLAKSILESGAYSFEGKPTALLIAGYPLFLSGVYTIFGDGQTAVKIIQSLLEAITIYLFYLCALYFLKSKYALISTAVFAFLPSNILFSQTILTEPLFGLISAAIFYLCLRLKVKNLWLLGLLWGAAIFVRSSFALSVFIIPLYLFISRKEIFQTESFFPVFKYSFIFIFFIIAALSPWLIRNYQQFGSFTLASQGGFTFWSGSNPNATGTWYHNIEETDSLFNEEDEIKRDREFYKRGIDFALRNPHKFIITGVKKLGYLFSSERMILLYFTKDEGKQRTSTEVYRDINPLYIGAVNLPYFAIMIFGLWGLLGLKEQKFFPVAFVITWCITIFLFVALARYHYVLIPFFTLGAGKLLQEGKNLFIGMSKVKITAGIIITLFFLGVWASEFYLMLK